MVSKQIKYFIIEIICIFLTCQQLFAEEYLRFNVLEYLKTDLDMAYEIKTDKFDRVVLDCQSILKEMTFRSQENFTVVNLDEETCLEIHDFIFSRIEKGAPICVGVDLENKYLDFSEEEPSSCY